MRIKTTGIVLSMQLIPPTGLAKWPLLQILSPSLQIQIPFIQKGYFCDFWEYRAICKSFPCEEILQLQSASFPQIFIHFQFKVLHRVVSIWDGTFIRHCAKIPAWWPCVRYDDAAQGCEIRYITGQIVAKDEESSSDSRRVQPRIEKKKSEKKEI